MEYRNLGVTDLNVSLICLGTMTWGCQNTEDEGHEQMDYALDQGVNFFDTAELYAVPPEEKTYGRTEEIIGTWFANRKNRDKVILASKVAGPGFSWIRNSSVLNRQSIEEAIEGSLKRLQTDYIDLYQLHWPNRPNYHFGNWWDYDPSQTDGAREIDGFVDILETLNDLVKAGKIRHIGLSDDSAWGAMTYLRLAEKHDLPRIQSIQNEYSLLCRVFEPDLSEVAVHENVGLLAWSPLATGMISGKYVDGAIPEGTRWAIRRDWRYNEISNQAVKEYMAVANKHGLDVCQMALAFINSRSFVTSNIIGATKMEQLKSNIESVNIKLSGDVLDDIEKVYKKYPKPY